MAADIAPNLEIIAEIANAHQGDPSQAWELAQAVALSADAIKFQIYFAEELLVERHPRFDHFKKQAFTKDQWHELIKKTKALDVKVYVDVFGLTALSIAKAVSYTHLTLPTR